MSTLHALPYRGTRIGFKHQQDARQHELEMEVEMHTLEPGISQLCNVIDVILRMAKRMT